MKKRFVSMILAIAMVFAMVVMPATATDGPMPRYRPCTHCDNLRAEIRTVKKPTGAEEPAGTAVCPVYPRLNCPVYNVQYVNEERCNQCNWLYSTSSPYTVAEMRHDHSPIN